jgi:hypothetical protein
MISIKTPFDSFARKMSDHRSMAAVNAEFTHEMTKGDQGSILRNSISA